ncbi:hypothetical protein JL721_1314 [Aureococcus anophagefferens]|nr:hypothetical protein JL721_1314 [Aureococcus anophagefferens]
MGDDAAPHGGSRPGTQHSSRPGSQRHAIRNWDPNGADAQFLSNFLDRWDKIARQRELMAGWSTWLELLRTYRKLKERRERMQMHASFFGLLREHAPGAVARRRRVDGHDARLLLGKSRKVPLRRAVYGAEEVRAPAPAPAAAVEEAAAPPPAGRDAEAALPRRAKKKARAVHEALPPPRDDESSLASYATPVDGDELEHLALDWDVLGQPMKDVHPGTGLGEAALLRNVDAADSTGERSSSCGASRLRAVAPSAGQLAAACAVVELATGEVACRRGDKVGRLCFVRRGELGLSARLGAARRRSGPSKTAELSRCGPGCCLGDLEVLEGLPTYLCTARAAMTTVVYAVARRDFERCVLHNPHSQGTKQTVAALRRAVEARKDFHAYRALVELQRLTGQKGLGALDAPAEHPYVCSEFEAALASKIEATFERVWDRSPAEALSKARTALALRPAALPGVADGPRPVAVKGGRRRRVLDDDDDDDATDGAPPPPSAAQSALALAMTSPFDPNAPPRPRAEVVSLATKNLPTPAAQRATYRHSVTEMRFHLQHDPCDLKGHLARAPKAKGQPRSLAKLIGKPRSRTSPRRAALDALRLSAIPAKQRAVMHTDELRASPRRSDAPGQEKQSRDDARRGLVRR